MPFVDLPRYLIHFTNEDKHPIDVPRPEVLPEAGDVLIFTKQWSTPSGISYQPGDEIHLMCRTEEAPWGKLSELGNWKCITKMGVTVWSNIEWLLATDCLEHE